MIYTLKSLYGSPDGSSVSAQLPSGRWVRAVPLPYYGGHLRGAWAVLTGRAVALRYPVDGELEDALSRKAQD